jgi:hypothetical protein
MSVVERSQPQIDASRANGAKSQGPTSPEGLERSSKNRLTHGFRSSTLTLSIEDKEEYDAHLAAYLKKYAPQDKTEEDLVGLAASSMWNYMRLSSVEVALLEHELENVDEWLERKHMSAEESERLALAFKRSAGSRALELVLRYKTTAERSFHRAIKALDQIVKARKPKQSTSAIRTQETAPKLEIVPANRPEPRPQAPPEAA